MGSQGQAQDAGCQQDHQSDDSLQSWAHEQSIGISDIALTGPHGRAISGQMFPIDGDSKSSQ